MPHTNDHNHGGCSHEATDSDHAQEMGIEYSLYQKIDMENLECLNETVEDSGKGVFKAYEERMNFDKFVESDVDQDILFNIPFTGNVKLKGLIVIGADDDTHPSKVKLYKNRGKMTFDDVALEPDQVLELNKDVNGELEYPIKVVQFSSVHDLTLYFPSNFGSDKTRIYYIGLKGEFHEAPNQGIVICNYELRPNAADHKYEAFDSINPPLV